MKKLICAIAVLALLLSAVLCISAENVLRGDVDMRGKVTAADARCVLRVSAGLDTLTDEQFVIADVDGSGKISAADARYILRCSAGIEKSDFIEIGSETVSEPDSEEETSEPVTEGVCYLNRFMSTSDGLEFYAAGCEVKKQDGFVFKYKQEIFVHDGGHKSTGDDSVFNYLSELRRSLLPEGVAEDDENYKLKITVILSHFHTDHVNTYIHDIVKSPYFEIDRAYMPEQSVFEDTTYFSDTSICDPYYYADGVITTKGRLRFLALIEEYSPETRVICLEFGETERIKSADGEVIFDMFAPSEDWGTAENAQKLLDLYYAGGASSSTAADFPKAVVNSNSLWLKITYGERTMLFTGDVMKRASNEYSSDAEGYVAEPFDLMLSYYAEKCGEDVFDVDIVKFPHHGQVRPQASKGVFEVFTPELVICTAVGFRETTIANAQEYWDKYDGSYCLSDGTGLYLFTDGTIVTVSRQGEEEVVIFDENGNGTDVSGEILQ